MTIKTRKIGPKTVHVATNDHCDVDGILAQTIRLRRIMRKNVVISTKVYIQIHVAQFLVKHISLVALYT